MELDALKAILRPGDHPAPPLFGSLNPEYRMRWNGFYPLQQFHVRTRVFLGF